MRAMEKDVKELFLSFRFFFFRLSSNNTNSLSSPTFFGNCVFLLWCHAMLFYESILLLNVLSILILLVLCNFSFAFVFYVCTTKRTSRFDASMALKERPQMRINSLTENYSRFTLGRLLKRMEIQFGKSFIFHQ
jgi:hypothetical protein